LLGDQGAEVIKIEPPKGDNLRNYPSTLSAEGRAFIGINRSKAGIVLDLKQPDDLAVLMKIVETADVLVHNFRPSVAPRLGISYEALSLINPRLIYCVVTGYGEEGPLAEKAGFDQVLQTMTGMCRYQGASDGKPEIIYGSVVDYYAAALLAGGVASALYERTRSGVGQYVGVSLLRAALTMQSARMVEGEPREINREMRSGGITGIHPTGDGYLYISANTPHFWKALCNKVGLPALADDPKYASVRDRARHETELVALLREALKARSATQWETLFGEEVPCARAAALEDMFDEPQVAAENMIADFDHSLAGRYRGFARAIKFGRTPGPDPFAAPALGEHSDIIRAKFAAK
jgi:formyl-CoA transferase